METTTKKEYDCVKEVRKQREQDAKALKGKTNKEIISWFREKRKKSALLRNKADTSSPEP